MTSELKPCNWCGAVVPCLDNACPLNNAVPDVPELVRYNYGYDDNTGKEFCMYENSYGEYVRHDQAAEMIAAKDAEIAGLKDCAKGLFDDRAFNRNRAEAKLATLDRDLI